MNDQPQPPDPKGADLLPMHREVMAEERRLQEMLERSRLEQAAKGAAHSKWLWLLYVPVLCYVTYSGTKHQGMINALFFFYIFWQENSANSRIDAIQKLAELDKREGRVHSDFP